MTGRVDAQRPRAVARAVPATPRRVSAALALCLTATALLALAAGGCATNPVTGQSDFVLMSEDQELAIGREANREVLAQYRPYEDAVLADWLRTTGQRLAALSHRPQLVYRFTLVDSPEVNAFALPGGYIYLTRGLLGLMNSEAEMAGVLGHEIGHVTARHGVRQASAAQAAGIGATIGAILFPELRGVGARNAVNLLGTALLRGYGRDQELEADRLGAEYLRRAGYDPEAMIDVLRVLQAHERFEQLAARAEGREPRAYHGLFATHPDNDTRLREAVSSVGPAPPGARRGDGPDFLRRLDGLVWGDSGRDGVLRGNSFFHRDLGFALELPAGWGVRNLPDRLQATAPGGGAVMELLVDDLQRRIPPREYMRERLGLGELRAEGELSPNGLVGHSAVALVRTGNGAREARVNVIYLRDKAFVLTGLVEDAANIPSYDRAFLDAARTFRPLSAEEAAGAARELRLRLAVARDGETWEGLAKGSPRGPLAAAELRLLNGVPPDARGPAPGTLVKLIH